MHINIFSFIFIFVYFSAYIKPTGGFNHKSMQTLLGSSPQTKIVKLGNLHIIGDFALHHKWMRITIVTPFSARNSGTTTMLVKRLLIYKSFTTSETFPKSVLLFPVLLYLVQMKSRKLALITLHWKLCPWYKCSTPNEGD